MSIKDLFGKTSPNLEETVQDVESVAFVEEKTKADQVYHPQIDFSDPENFVYYGSAELYYDAAIRRIYEDYPYDGSKSEQIAFEEKASALERWMFETKYPKTTGHVQLGTTAAISGAPSGPWAPTSVNEYIKIWGGLHTDSSAKNLNDHFASSAKYDNDKNRNQNWNCDFEKGVTVEFWLKKDQFNPATEPREVVLDLWNGNPLLPLSDYGRFTISLDAATATTGDFVVTIGDQVFQITSTSIDFTTWKHYALSFIRVSSGIEITVYVNGNEFETFTMSTSITSFVGKMDGFIGALQTQDDNGDGGLGYGKLSAQMDEFRFWKTNRTSRQIKLNWFNAIGGGANTDDATSDLGVYLKFNEGIVGTNAADSVVLDYSGRLANGVWVGYESTTNARSTDSAMESMGYTETPTPIIYKEHSDVKSLISEMKTKGLSYDADRGQSFFRSMPTWLQEEDNGNLRLFAQILGSYMDTLHVQIKELTELKTKRYPMEGVKTSTMAADLLKDKGFMISNMFESNEVYEKLASVNLQDAQFETELHEIKNIIYTNIYNNLEKIYKTKGTESSIRNLIRCYGIDDELIRLNLYTDGGVQYFTDKSRPTSVKKKYVNFNHPESFDASIFQSITSTSSRSFISSAVDASRNAFTLEADIVVPYKKEIDERGYFATPFLSSSVMGFHEAQTDPADLTWGTQNLSVYLVRDSLNSRHAKFVMRDIAGNIEEESDYIYDIYENEHYNVALRIKPQTYPYAGGVTNTTPDYDIELYAVTTNFGEIENEVLLSTTVSNSDGLALMNASKRVYVGAHAQDFTGTVLQETDIQVGGVRAWLDYVENNEILNHNKDVLNYGQSSSIDGSNLYLIDDVQIPSQDLTILNWDFDTVSTSDSIGEFEVEDTTGGHSDTVYGWIDDLIRREHKAKGSNFPLDDTSVVGYEFIQAYKKQLPESAYDAQNIYIKGDQEINFSNDDDVSDNLFIMEKSPSALISEEMLKSFSTTLEFANLVGRPVERFRLEYKDLAKARQLFFDKVESDMDFDKFFEYFKWIDSSISSMVNQLVPMSANFAGGIVDVIEPHLLERDKYQRQVGLLNTITSTEASIRGVQELKYNWRVGHAPLSGDENENCLWQKERKENSVVEEEAIRQVLVRQNDQEFTNPVVLSGSTQLISGSYAARRFSKPYALDIGFSNSIHGGINYSANKDRDMITSQIAVGNASTAGTPENVVIIGAGDGTGTNPKPACIDEHRPEELRKYKYDGFAVLGRHAILSSQEPKSDDDQYAYRQKISKIIPGNIVSSSVNTGYSALINSPAADGGFGEGFDLVNLHSDTTDITNEISIQGPFTHTHIGGRQSRHVHYMEGFDETVGNIPNIADRPESWNIYIAELDATETQEGSGVGDGAIGFTTPDYSVGSLDSDQQKATLYREERAKRPVNIKNIQTNLYQDENGDWHQEGNYGNFIRNYEAMSTFGDQGYFLRRAGDLLPDIIESALPETTNYYTLASQFVTTVGNLFAGPNNRYNDTGYTVPAVQGVAGQTATGGGFTILDIDRVAQGQYITIDSIIYEIETSIQGDVAFPLESTNVAFYNGLKSALEVNFPINTFTVNYVEFLTETLAEVASEPASGGSFRVLGVDDIASGDFITIDLVDYEIGTNSQSGQTIAVPSTNIGFYNNIQSLLVNNFSNDFTIAYNETLTQIQSPQPGQTASGGTFKILGFDDVVSGEFITIDSIDYEIDTSVQGGQTLLTTPTPASNTDFFNSLKTLLVANFPVNDFTVTFTEGDNGGQPPGSAGQALTITGADADIGLEFVGKPSWSPTAPGATSQPFTMSFYINAPVPALNTNSVMTIYSEFWTTGTQQINTASKLLNLTYSTNNGWTLSFSIGYRRDGGQLTIFRHDFHNFLGQYGGHLTHVLITTEGTMNHSTYDINGNIISRNTQTKLYINGVYQNWDAYVDQNLNGGVPEDYYAEADPNFPHLSPEIYKFYIGTYTTSLSNTRGISQPNETTILDEFMIFDAYFGGNQNLIDEIYNNGNQLDYSNLSNLTTYANAKAFYTFSETNDGFTNGDTIHNKVANSENLTVYDNSSDRISTSFSGPPTSAGTIVYHAEFSIVPINDGTYGNFAISVDPNYSSFPSANNEISDSINGADPISAVYSSEAEFTITPNSNGSFGNFNVAIGTGNSFSNPQDSTGGVDFAPAENDSEAQFTIVPLNNGIYGNFDIALLGANNSFINPSNSIDGVDYVASVPSYFVPGITNIIDRQDRSTGSANVIRTRFSAPGGPEINSSGYLDIATQQYSVHNSLNFRNLSVRLNGSGEDGEIRVVSHANHREGLRTLRSRHSAKFGLDPQHATPIVNYPNEEITYNEEPSFHKQHRNTSRFPSEQFSDSGVPTVGIYERRDNDHFHRPMPATDFQYSWIHNALNGDDAPQQDIINTAPKNGLIGTTNGYEEAIKFNGLGVELDDCTQDPIADPFVTWGSTGQFTDDEDFSLFIQENSTTSQTILDFSEIGTLQFSFNNLGCSTVSALQSLVENGQPRSFESSVSLPTLYFNPDNSAIFDYATKRSGYIEDQEVTLVNVSTGEPTLESEINYLQRTTPGGATTVVTRTPNDIIELVPFSSTPGAFEVTIAEANQSYHSFSSQNIQCADAYQGLEVDSVFIGNDSTAPPWNNLLPTLYYSSGVFTQVDSTVYMCSGYFEDTISNSFSNATTTAPTLVSNVTFYDDDGSGGRATSTAESKTTTVVPGSSSPGANQVSEAEANLTTFGYVASSHLADNIDGSLEFELSESDATLNLSQTFGPQATVPSSFSQIYYSSNSSDQVILTLTSRSTGTGLIVEDDSTIIFENATLDNTLLESTVSYPNYGTSGWATRTITSDGSRVNGGVTQTITLKDPSSSTPINSANLITETQANNDLTFSSVATNMPCASSATYQLYTTDEDGVVEDDGIDPTNSRPNVEYSAGDSVSFRVIVEQCTDSAGNPYTDEITLTIQDAALVQVSPP